MTREFNVNAGLPHGGDTGSRTTDLKPLIAGRWDGFTAKGGLYGQAIFKSGQFDPTNWQTIARMHLRTRYEDFPEEDIEIVGGYMGDVSMPPPPGAIYLCETDSMDQGIAEVTERFSLAVEGSKPWTFLLYSTSEYDSGRLVARVLWHDLDPIRAGLKLWTAYLKWRSPRFICPYETRAGEYWLEDEVAAAIARSRLGGNGFFIPSNSLTAMRLLELPGFLCLMLQRTSLMTYNTKRQ